MKTVEYIIVGQGIAGTWLSFELLKRKISFVVVDEHSNTSASTVASGIINPITGRRFVKTWLADTLIPYADKAYSEFQQLLDSQFLRKMNMFRLFHSIKEQNDWSTKADSNNFKGYLSSDEIIHLDQNKIKNDFGGFEIENCLVIDGSTLINEFRNYLEKNELILNETFDFKQLNISASSIGYKSISCNKIIFAEGFGATTNPLFNYLPFVPAKGELLIIESKELQLNSILNSSLTILPLGDDKYYVGATKDWNDTSNNPTDAMKMKLTSSLNEMILVDYKIIEHKAGVRPTVKDRRPFLGNHPKHKNVFIFNGLGTKGYSLAPFFAQELIDFTETGTPIQKEADIKRYEQHFTK